MWTHFRLMCLIINISFPSLLCSLWMSRLQYAYFRSSDSVSSWFIRPSRAPACESLYWLIVYLFIGLNWALITNAGLCTLEQVAAMQSGADLLSWSTAVSHCYNYLLPQTDLNKQGISDNLVRCGSSGDRIVAGSNPSDVAIETWASSFG